MRYWDMGPAFAAGLVVSICSVKSPAQEPIERSSTDAGVKNSQPAKENEKPPDLSELMEEIRSLREQMQQQKEKHDAEMAAMQQQIDQLKGGVAAPSAPAAQPPANAEAELDALIGNASPSAPSATATTPQASGTLLKAFQSLNPEISLNGDFLLSYSSNEGGEVDDQFLLRELEFGFGGAVDPYSRADVYFSIAKDNDEFKTDLEEAYLTFLELPYHLQARFGQYRAEFGRVNPMHLHALPWIDYPLVIQSYFGDEGLIGVGAELSWLVPNPWDR